MDQSIFKAEPDLNEVEHNIDMMLTVFDSLLEDYLLRKENALHYIQTTSHIENSVDILFKLTLQTRDSILKANIALGLRGKDRVEEATP